MTNRGNSTDYKEYYQERFYGVQFDDMPLGFSLCPGKHRLNVYVDEINNNYYRTQIKIGSMIYAVNNIYVYNTPSNTIINFIREQMKYLPICIVFRDTYINTKQMKFVKTDPKMCLFKLPISMILNNKHINNIKLNDFKNTKQYETKLIDTLIDELYTYQCDLIISNNSTLYYPNKNTIIIPYQIWKEILSFISPFEMAQNQFITLYNNSFYDDSNFVIPKYFGYIELILFCLLISQPYYRYFIAFTLFI
eukprot:536465_1